MTITPDSTTRDSDQDPEGTKEQGKVTIEKEVLWGPLV